MKTWAQRKPASAVQETSASRSGGPRGAQPSIQRKAAGAVTASSRMGMLQRTAGNQAVQRWMAGNPVQRMELPEEEELQLKRDSSQPVQRMELPEEEELQLKRDSSQPVQRMELPEEEELQLKRDSSQPVQRMELPEEEELQLKRDSSQPVQRMELPEEEELQLKRDSSQPVQRMELPEEEELQLKRDSSQPVQRMELPEEEELQLKRDSSQPVQRMELPEEEELQLKRDSSQPVQRMELPEEEELQLKEDSAASNQNGKLPALVQRSMEDVIGGDFSDINIHEGMQAKDINALAYAQGNDVHFAPGMYNPTQRKGQELLGHELTHVVQQKQGKVKPTMMANGVSINDDPGLEREADQMGRKAASFIQTKLSAQPET